MSKQHQIFIGCPFHQAIRKNYDKLKREIERETPLHMVLADTTAISSTDYLLKDITNLIQESAACIFDVTGGNPNVSLEVGIAHALPSEFLLALYTRRPRAPEIKAAETALAREGETKPIISDLQGRNRIEYKAYPSLKNQILKRYLVKLPFMKRWQEFKKRHGTYIKHALEVFSEIRSSGRTQRSRVLAMLDGSGLRADDLLKSLTKAKLLSVRRGRAGGIYYPST